MRPIYFKLLVTLLFIQSVSSCDDSAGLCFELPENCSPSSSTDASKCKALLLINYVNDSLEVSLSGKIDPDQWFAVGFGQNKNKMDGALVVHCKNPANGPISIGVGYTTGTEYTEDETSNLIENASSKSDDQGIIHCKWTQRPVTQVGSSTFDVNKQYYIILVSGPLRPDGSLNTHRAKRASSEKANLMSFVKLKGVNSIPTLIKLHGSLMTIAWLCLVSTAIMFARHFKDSWTESTLWGVKLWFAFHRGLMVSALLFVAIGMISIFVYVGGWRANSPHPWLGLFANCLMILQPIGAFFRPSPSSSNRKFFNIGHFLLGNSGHFLAILTLFFAQQLTGLTLSSGYTLLLILFAIVYIVTHLLMQFLPRFLYKFNVIQDIPMNDLKNNTSSPSQDQSKIERFRQMILIVYVALIVIIGISLIVTICNAKP